MLNTPTIFKDKYIALIFAASAVILFVAGLVTAVNLYNVNNLLVIHFDSFRGADFFGDRTDVFEIVFTAIAVLIINLFLANEFYHREKFLSYVLAVGTFIFSVLILTAVNVIISIN